MATLGPTATPHPIVIELDTYLQKVVAFQWFEGHLDEQFESLELGQFDTDASERWNTDFRTLLDEKVALIDDWSAISPPDLFQEFHEWETERLEIESDVRDLYASWLSIPGLSAWTEPPYDAYFVLLDRQFDFSIYSNESWAVGLEAYEEFGGDFAFLEE